jgi:NAD(P)H-dependent flavin oxidoreductase YrpB (nitropropane dioxygenase family)
MQLATEEGDNQKGVLPVGQVTGLIKDVPKVAEVIAQIVAEAEGIQKKMAAMMA